MAIREDYISHSSLQTVMPSIPFAKVGFLADQKIIRAFCLLTGPHLKLQVQHRICHHGPDCQHKGCAVIGRLSSCLIWFGSNQVGRVFRKVCFNFTVSDKHLGELLSDNEALGLSVHHLRML